MANHTQDGHIGQHITGSHKKTYNQKPDIGFSTAPQVEPDQTAVGILAKLTEWWDLAGTSDLTGQHDGQVLTLDGPGNQAMADADGPDLTASGAILLTGSVGARLVTGSSVAVQTKFGLTGSGMWIFWYRITTAVLTTRTLIRKGTNEWGFYDYNSANQTTFGPNTVTSNSLITTNNVWTHVACWRDDADGRVRHRLNGTTTYTSAGTGSPIATTADQVEIRGGGTGGIAFSRVAWIQNDLLTEDEIDYLHTNISNYADLVAAANP